MDEKTTTRVERSGDNYHVHAEYGITASGAGKAYLVLERDELIDLRDSINEVLGEPMLTSRVPGARLVALPDVDEPNNSRVPIRILDEQIARLRAALRELVK